MNDKLKLTITAIFFVATMQAQIFEPVPLDKKWHIGGGSFRGLGMIMVTIHMNIGEIYQEQLAISQQQY